MKSCLNLWFILIITLVFLTCSRLREYDYAVAIHGGAGNIDHSTISEEAMAQYQDKLGEALDSAVFILKKGGTCVDAVEKAITILEDSPLFNAGKGAVFTREGKNELDAAIMEGQTLNAGAVASVGDIKNPIRAARLVMEKSEHVMLIGRGASAFARSHGLEMADSSYFFTDRRWKSLQRQMEKDKAEKYSTVGCVALDIYGNLAAGTSTGGMTNKMPGRIGDSPIIGAGNYANNRTCAVSATGHGEYFIRYTVAHDISSLMEYAGMSLAEAAHHVIHEKLAEIDAKGGVICVDKKGNITLEFNTTGMLRGYANSMGDREILIFGKEEN